MIETLAVISVCIISACIAILGIGLLAGYIVRKHNENKKEKSNGRD